MTFLPLCVGLLTANCCCTGLLILSVVRHVRALERTTNRFMTATIIFFHAQYALARIMPCLQIRFANPSRNPPDGGISRSYIQWRPVSSHAMTIAISTVCN